ncbi:MAG: DUF1934 domain-containing protein [Ruminococcus sp.]|nr:DUF1934 domain-containing protein [Ruminococcus sp.]
MKDNFIISVTGVQTVDGDKETIKLTTAGEFTEENGVYTIRYKEYDNDNPDICFDNAVTLDGNIVTVIRKGPAQSRLTLEKGRRHQCHYCTMYGDLMVGVYTSEVESTLTPQGGTLQAAYTLDFNAGLVSKNEIYIKVTEKEVN